MRGRRRAVLTAGLAALVGLAGMTAVRGYSETVSRQFGALRSVVVTTTPLEAGTVIDPQRAGQTLEGRRIPMRFAPSGSLELSSDAVGLEALVDLPSGSYMTTSVLSSPDGSGRRAGGSWTGLVPVEVTVHGVGALPGRGRRVDVLVSSAESFGRDSGTTLAARSALLVDVSATTEVGSAPGTGLVTLGLDRREAIRLVDAEADGRRITVIPVPTR